MVSLDDPVGGAYYGGSVAGPVFAPWRRKSPNSGMVPQTPPTEVTKVLKLAEIVKTFKPLAVVGPLDHEITGIAYDSRHVIGHMFVAMRGERTDGCRLRGGGHRTGRGGDHIGARRQLQSPRHAH